MLDEKLQEFWDAKKFATSWIISSNNLEESLKQIKNFAQKVFNIPNLPIDNNPDFCVVERDDTKSITIDQIRKLQSFLYSTSMVGEYKFAVIMEADLMNNNASNCCLKILEEPPRESYLFMLTKSPINLSATIRSRCHKIHIPSLQDTYHNESYKDFIDYLLDYNIDKRMNYLQSISTKAKLEEWVKFCNNSVRLLFQIMKHKSDSTVNLDKNEISYLHSYAINISNMQIMSKLEKVQKLIKDADDFDLDKRHIGILITECLI